MTDDKDIKAAWFNFLKAFTRGLVQVNLYKPDHPQVRQVLEEAHTLLTRIIEASPNNEFILTLDNNNLIVNTFPLLTADKLPNSLKNIFQRFQAQSITFLTGVSQEDIRLLCQMQSFKGNGAEYLKRNNIDKIILSQAVYTKENKTEDQAAGAPEQKSAAPDGAGTGTGAGGEAGNGGGGGETAEKLDETLEPQNFEAAIGTIVAKTTRDAAEQKRIMEIVMKKFRAELETQVNRALTVVRQEKKKVENDIARTEAVMSNIAEGVVVVDKDGRILMMNPQAEAISGMGLTDLSGRKILDVAQMEQVVSLSREIRSDGTRDLASDVDQKGKSDLSAAIKKSTALIQNEEGKIVGSVSIPTDKTKFREMEKLQQDFIANMTHELRSPLTSIKAALEILARDSKPDDSGKGMLNTAIRNSERLNSIITDILDFSKLQSGKLVFHQENAQSEEIAREASDAMKAWANTKNISLTVKTQPGVSCVYADKRRTVQVLINLISNAIKFTPQGGAIEISVDDGHDAQSGFVFFSVKDNGCGIKKEDQAKIFEKFVQVAAGEKVGGTGLGLSITKAMTVMQSGKISLESDQGRGATFRVAMPVYRGQLETPVFEPLPEVKGTKPWWKTLLGI
ncbi:MAG: PAS domain-containing sensor histidine kinase [Elusimicrobiales bacterium]|jgi:PAS domain S-box-containing protein